MPPPNYPNTNPGTAAPGTVIPPNLRGSVIREPLPGEYAGLGDYVLYISSVADDIPPWGMTPQTRDRLLREFFPTEPLFCSALWTTVSKYAAFGWTLTGPDRMVDIYERLLHSTNRGKGWLSYITCELTDILTQDNGCFTEIIRTDDDARAPVIGLNHLDANRCIRTGRAEAPVIYYDRWAVPHLLSWYQVFSMEEMPSPIERMRGMQYSALTRLLKCTQIMRDTIQYNREKLSGRFNKQIHFVQGVRTETVSRMVQEQQARAEAQGWVRFVQPAVIGTLDPDTKLDVKTLDLAKLPDNFDEDKFMRWYITVLAMAFGNDYQDYAPLPGNAMGTSQQSETLMVKARGKGPKMWMSLVEHVFNFHGIFPKNVMFTYGDQDLSEDLDNTKLSLLRAEQRAMRVKSGEISPDVARMLAVEHGDLDAKYLDQLDGYEPTMGAAGVDGAEQMLSGRTSSAPGGGQRRSARTVHSVAHVRSSMRGGNALNAKVPSSRTTGPKVDSQES